LYKSPRPCTACLRHLHSSPVSPHKEGAENRLLTMHNTALQSTLRTPPMFTCTVPDHRCTDRRGRCTGRPVLLHSSGSDLHSTGLAALKRPLVPLSSFATCSNGGSGEFSP
jgi:hypothetical protein